MASLTGRNVRDSYIELLKLNTASTNTGVTGSLLDVTDGGNTASALSISNSQIASSVDGSAGTAAFTRKGDTNTGVFFPAADTIAVTTTGAERLRIDADGNVGIGQTPINSRRLTISTTGQADLSIVAGSANYGQLLFGYTGADNKGIVAYNNADNSMQFYTNGTERLRIDSSGNVGIGTTSPGTTLNVVGNSLVSNQTGNLDDDIVLISGQPRLALVQNPSSTADNMWLVAVGANSVGPTMLFAKTRSAATDAATIVNADDQLLNISGCGSDGAGRYRIGAGIVMAVDGTPGAADMPGRIVFSTTLDGAASPTERMRITNAGNVGIGMTPTAQLELSTDSAKKPSTNTWTIASDRRLKTNITNADNDRCYEIVKQVPLKRYTWKSEVYSQEQVKDRSKLGWIAQDVEAVFPKAVGTNRFAYNQVFEDVVTPELDAEGNAVFEDVFVPELDSEGNAVFNEDGVAKTKTEKSGVAKTRTEKRLVSEEVIEDCKDLNSDQIYAAMYGTIQKLIEKVETLEAKVVALQVA